ncbi:hypothetical protein SAMN02745217_01274 [Anaerocolumna xylanovorans DSM 12503]|uniref:Uncharacterized protein n=1 Tax=Anaerocolumna xylanovorans DSM 12503 TaxID=1121345 RepID=A0A1M7Y3L8_9FIRM|nr:hypothetical protein SAMN02745217_01274 [Anaerocolumna xylanovorans DSM 12503]
MHQEDNSIILKCLARESAIKSPAANPAALNADYLSSHIYANNLAVCVDKYILCIILAMSSKASKHPIRTFFSLSAATLLISDNVDVRTVSARFGHAYTSTAMNIYFICFLQLSGSLSDQGICMISNIRMTRYILLIQSYHV